MEEGLVRLDVAQRQAHQFAPAQPTTEQEQQANLKGLGAERIVRRRWQLTSDCQHTAHLRFRNHTRGHHWGGFGEGEPKGNEGVLLPRRWVVERSFMVRRFKLRAPTVRIYS
jgi:hypothetical protein